MATAANSAMARMRADRIFYSGVPAAVAVVVLWGFARSWFLRPIDGIPEGFSPLTPLLIVHGLVFTAWIALNALQPLLIAAGNRALHRTMGWVGAGLATAMLVLIPIATIESMRHGGPSIFPSIYLFFAVNLIGALEFGLSVGLAIAWRKRADYHKRLMMLALVPLIPPAVARIPGAGQFMPALGLVVMNLPIVLGILYDMSTRRRVHNVWLWGGPLMIGSEALMSVIGFSSWWRVFCEWAMRLPV